MNNSKCFNSDSVVVRISEIPSVDLDGEVGMMNISRGKYYSLDSVGTRIWELLENPIQVSLLIESLQLEYNVEKNQCEMDVVTFLKKLIDEDLVRTVSE